MPTYLPYPGGLLDLKGKPLFETYLSKYICIQYTQSFIQMNDIHPLVGLVWAYWIPFSIYCIPQQIGG